jgi:hypothetical protein
MRPPPGLDAEPLCRVKGRRLVGAALRRLQGDDSPLVVALVLFANWTEISRARELCASARAELHALGPWALVALRERLERFLCRFDLCAPERAPQELVCVAVPPLRRGRRKRFSLEDASPLEVFFVLLALRTGWHLSRWQRGLGARRRRYVGFAPPPRLRLLLLVLLIADCAPCVLDDCAPDEERECRWRTTRRF